MQPGNTAKVFRLSHWLLGRRMWVCPKDSLENKGRTLWRMQTRSGHTGSRTHTPQGADETLRASPVVEFTKSRPRPDQVGLAGAAGTLRRGQRHLGTERSMNIHTWINTWCLFPCFVLSCGSVCWARNTTRLFCWCFYFEILAGIKTLTGWLLWSQKFSWSYSSSNNE